MTTSTLQCRSLRTFVSVGPVPPRTPGRTDAQVPTSLDDGPARYAKVPHLYFYTNESGQQDAAFGFVDIEISLQRLGTGRYSVELYCSGDGYQSGTGCSEGAPLQLEFWVGERVVARLAWPYANVRSGTADPLTFKSDVTLADADFSAIDMLAVPSTTATCRVDLDD